MSDFTNPSTFLIRLKVKNDDRVFFCPRSAVKSFTMNNLKFEDVFELDEKTTVEELLTFLKVFTGDIFAEVKHLNCAEQQALIRTAVACGMSLDNEFDSFGVLSDAIFDGDPIDWKIWKALAQFYQLNMYVPAKISLSRSNKSWQAPATRCYRVDWSTWTSMLDRDGTQRGIQHLGRTIIGAHCTQV